MIDNVLARTSWRRTVSAALVLIGGTLLVLSVASIARGEIARSAARGRWAELEAARSVAGARATASPGASWPAAIGSPVARLLVPRVGIDEVVVEGVNDAELRAGPGHMVGSAVPGDSGTSVISAHRDRHFHRLSGIQVGDTIVTESAHGTTTWAVRRVRVVHADAPALRSSTTPTLVLTTCWPIRYLGPAPDRLIVEAEPR